MEMEKFLGTVRREPFVSSGPANSCKIFVFPEEISPLPKIFLTKLFALLILPK
jgi:hypothetical protein